MNKNDADRLISGYVRKLFGFARQRLSDIAEAEEFAAELTLTVYKALLKAQDIANPDGYVWRVAKNCYARYIGGRKQFTAVDGIEFIPDNHDFTQELADSESYGILRREITYLGKTQREIIVLHYFHDKKVREIAEILSIPENTVKWHLACSRKELKDGMDKVRTTGTLGAQPIRFINMGHCGTLGDTMYDTSNFLAKNITQNIAYAAYHQPRNINEIAEELGINPIFVEDEVAVLEEYGFMDKLPNGRYRTNIQMIIPNKENYEIGKAVMEKYIPLFAEKYFIPALESITEIPEWISVPDNDLNLYKWCLIMPMADQLAVVPGDNSEFSVKRPDGGDYIAFATLDVKQDWLPGNGEEWKYIASCGPMWRNEFTDTKWWKSWQFNCYWSDRKLDWHECQHHDFDKLYFFTRGELPDTVANIESYQILLDKGYLLKTDGEYKLNIITCASEKQWWEHIPAAPEDIGQQCEACAAGITKAELIGQPEHMHAQIKHMNRNAAACCHTRMMKYLVDNGVLKDPTPEQKKGLCTILFLGE